MLSEEKATDIPVLVAVDAINTRVQVETTEGVRYTGLLVSMDNESGNIELLDVRCQGIDSSLSVMERVFVPGSQVRLMHLRWDVSRSPYLQWRKESVAQILSKSFKSSTVRERAEKQSANALDGRPAKASTSDRRKSQALKEKRKKSMTQKLLNRGRK